MTPGIEGHAAEPCQICGGSLADRELFIHDETDADACTPGAWAMRTFSVGFGVSETARWELGS